MTRIVFFLISASLLALLATPSGIAPSDPCVDVGTASACGQANAFVCSGTASGEATGIVTWTFKLRTTSPTHEQTDSFVGPAATFADTTDYCTTGTCTKALLYANNVLVAESLWVC